MTVDNLMVDNLRSDGAGEAAVDPRQVGLLEAFAQGRMNRRDLIKRGLAVGLSLTTISAFIAACGAAPASAPAAGTAGTPSASPTAAAPTATPARTAKPTVEPSEILIVQDGTGPERLIDNDRFHFIATADQTGGRYSSLSIEVPIGGGPSAHSHTYADEWFYVLEGAPLFYVGLTSATLGAGDFVHVPMGTTHWFEVKDAPIRVLAGYAPGGVELTFM